MQVRTLGKARHGSSGLRLEAEAGGPLGGQDQPGLHQEFQASQDHTVRVWLFICLFVVFLNKTKQNQKTNKL